MVEHRRHLVSRLLLEKDTTRRDILTQVSRKIMTVGERAEDVFYVTDFDGRPLDAPAAERLRESLARALDRRDAA